ncbi:MMPL family transporter [Jiangella mangrovi]|uniref:RND superfamily putative drug exporter n=1 Tax=Jiangella mangrovi TaxID=1524084 RepID=A0A7W9GRE9_9ACTN|nr:MMPL family transporter [Jiangella mangrovi]MBB5788658.1 RND superfamily putative drug exporter [Jiangella mangrovi]
MARRLAGFVTRRGRAVLVVALLLALLGGATSMSLFGKLSAGGFDDPGSESGRAADLLEDTFGQSPPNLALLVTAPDRVDSAASTTAGTRLTEGLAGEDGVRDVVSYWTSGQPQLRSAGGDRALVLATITGDETEVNERVGELASEYGGALADGVDVQVGGYAAFSHELTEQSEKDVVTGEMIVFPVTLIALVLVFGGFVAALLPLAVAAATSLLGMGLLWVLADVTELSVFAANVVTLAGLGLAIDYSLLMVNRYREELAGGRTVPDAIRATLTSAGRTIVFASLTVCIALATLILVPLPAIRSIGYAGVLTALLAASASLIVLSALFAVLGRRVGTPRLRRRRNAVAGDGVENGFWHRLATFVMRRPLPIATVVTAVLLLLGAPFLGMKLGYLDERVMPDSSEARQVATTIREEFATGEQDALQVVIPAGGDADAVGDYAQGLSGLDHVARVDTVTGSYAGGAAVAAAGPAHERFAADDAVYLSVVPEAETVELTRELVGAVRAVDAPFETLVGGTAAMAEDADRSLLDVLPWALGAVGLAMVVLLFLLTGSVLLPFLALVLSTLSLSATFGAMVWIFQDGNLSGLFDFTVTGTTISTVPVMLFALAFGLAMDYQVFMLSRIREEYDRGAAPTAAVALGLEKVGRIVTAAAVLISIVFLAFLVSDITLMKAFGVGLPLAVLIDATLIRGALLPATMRLLGRATWWAPAWLRRVHARFGLREFSAAEGAAEAAPVYVGR